MFKKLVAARLRAVERDALQRAREIIVLSHSMGQTLREVHGVSLPPVRVVPGGVNLQQFAPVPNRAALRAQLGLQDSDFLFLSPRRLDPRMGLDVLIRAFAIVALTRPHARLWLTGDGPDAARLRALIEELRLGERAKLLGRVSDTELVDLLNAADCAVIPSLQLEGFGLATAEALACGTPVLGSLAGATPELLAELDPHLLFQPNSVEALAQKLESILRMPENKTALPTRIQCRHYAELRFSWDTTVHAIEEIAALRTAGGCT